LEPHPNRLSAPDRGRRVAGEQQIDLELAVRDLGIDLADRELVALAVDDVDGRRLADRNARDVELVDERVDLERADLVDLPDPLPGRFRFADVRLEQRELARDRRDDDEVVEVLARNLEIFPYRGLRRARRLDLGLPELLVDPQSLVGRDEIR